MELDRGFIFSEWEKLTPDEKEYIINNYWNPYEPQIGISTKYEIINSFIKSIHINSLQYGIRSFGWGVYLLFVIVENSKIRIPKRYSGISVNKGIVKDWIDEKYIKVKFDYGGIEVICLKERVVVR